MRIQYDYCEVLLDYRGNRKYTVFTDNTVLLVANTSNYHNQKKNQPIDNVQNKNYFLFTVRFTVMKLVQDETSGRGMHAF